MLPHRASPAAIVVDRCQCGKVVRSSGDRAMRHEDLRPRALVISVHGCRWHIPTDTGTRPQSQANVDLRFQHKEKP